MNGGSAEAEGVKVGREFEPDPEPEPEPEKEPEEGEGGEEGEAEVRMQGGWMDGGGVAGGEKEPEEGEAEVRMGEGREGERWSRVGSAGVGESTGGDEDKRGRR